MATTQSILIRSVSEDPEQALRDIGQCVSIQRAVGWESEAVPSHVLRADSIGLLTSVVDLGYVVVAEDAASASVVGFARVTFTGEAAKHWLHELAVLPQFQGMGIGMKLMMWIRRRSQETGARAILFTFDPFSAGNGRLYLNTCGASGVRVLANLYGGAHDATHGGLHTHRLLTCWDLSQGDAAVNRYDPKDVPLAVSVSDIKQGRPFAVTIPSPAAPVNEKGGPELPEKSFAILRDAINAMGYEAVGVEPARGHAVTSMVLMPRLRS